MSDADFVTYHHQDDEGELGSATARIRSALQRRVEREANALLAADRG